MYDHLKNITLIDTGRVRPPKSSNPEGLTLRIFANGDVYPSKELVERFKLEYNSEDSTQQSFGLDIVDSLEWTPTASMPRMILIGIVNKQEPKVDLFGTCRYNEDKTPKSSVITQGPRSEELLDLVRSLGYLTDEQKYCDLEFVVEHPVTTQDGILYIPKTVARGANKGEKTYIRRENVSLYPVNTVENLKTIREAKPQTEAEQVPA